MRGASILLISLILAVGVSLWLGLHAGDRPGVAQAVVPVERTGGASVNRTEGAPPDSARSRADEASPRSSPIPVDDIDTPTPNPIGPVDVQVLRKVERGVQPAPQAACALALLVVAPDGSAVRVGEGVTDHLGLYRFRVDAALPSDSRLEARVIEPGFVQRATSVKPAPDEEVVSVTLTAERGGTARGRLVDEHGRAQAGTVSFRSWLGAAGTSQLERRAHSRVESNGCFRLHFTGDVAVDGRLTGMLIARAEGVGTGVLRDLDWSLDELPQELSVIVRAGARLAGIVRDHQGSPVAGLELRASLAGVAKESGYATLDEAETTAFLVEDGLIESETITRRDGRFEIDGLRAGRYHVRTRSSRSVHHSRYDVEITEQPVPTGEASVELIVERPRLVVALERPDGSSWAGALDVQRRTRSGTRLPHTWPERVQVQLVPAQHLGGRWIPLELDHLAYLGGVPTGDGAVAFEVKPDTDYLLAVIGRDAAGLGFDGEPVNVRLPEGSIAHTVTVRARELGAFGSLIVHAKVTPIESHADRFLRLISAGKLNEPIDGLPLPLEPEPYTARVSSLLLIEDRETNLSLLSAAENSASPFRFELPAGRYRVAARLDNIGSKASFGTLHGGGSVELEIIAGQTTIAHLEIGSGGWLRVRVADGADSAWLRLVDARGRERPLSWCSSIKDEQRKLTNRWPAGETHDSEPLPAGDYRVIGIHGDALVDATITIVDGERAQLRIE